MPHLVDSTIQFFGNEVFIAAAAPLAPGVPQEAITSNPVERIELVHEDLLKWLYKPHGRNLDRVFILLETIGVRRNYFLYVTSLFLSYILCSSWGPLVSNLIGLIYPAYITLLDRTAHIKKNNHWLIYWPMFGVFSLLDPIADWFLPIFPVYYVVKSAFLVWLWIPQSGGTCYVHKRIITKFVNFVEKKFE